MPTQIDNTPSLDNSVQENNTPSPEYEHDEDVQLGDLWVENKQQSQLKKLTNTESFHVYVDEVRFIPDNATVIKVQH